MPLRENARTLAHSFSVSHSPPSLQDARHAQLLAKEELRLGKLHEVFDNVHVLNTGVVECLSNEAPVCRRGRVRLV